MICFKVMAIQYMDLVKRLILHLDGATDWGSLSMGDRGGPESGLQNLIFS